MGFVRSEGQCMHAGMHSFVYIFFFIESVIALSAASFKLASRE